jgi:membrane protein YqaA with SNARE-associated domain
VLADALKHPAVTAPARRAAVFGVALLVLGAAAILLRLFRSEVHPQIVLFVYSIPANSAISLFSHEVALLDYGSHQPLLLTVFSATLGTVVAGWLDWNVFVPLLDWEKVAAFRGNRLYRWAIDLFARAPFAVLVIAGLDPLPFFPFKFLAFSMRYPLARYLAALAISRAPRYALLAWLGREFQIPEWLLLGLFLAVLAFALWHHLRARTLLDPREGP